MSAFNCLNGVPASGNRFTLTEVLRDQWGFNGFVVSDWNAVAELVHHGFAADRAHAAAAALSAGVDMEMVSDCYRTDLPALLDAGSVSDATLDTAVRRILRVKILKGLLRPPLRRPGPTRRRGGDRPGAGGRCAELRAVEECRRHAAAAGRRHHRLDRTRWPTTGRSFWAAGPALGRAEDVVTLREGLAAALPAATSPRRRGLRLHGRRRRRHRRGGGRRPRRPTS